MNLVSYQLKIAKFNLDNGVVVLLSENVVSTLISQKSLLIKFFEVFCIPILPLDHSTAPKSWNITLKNKDVKIQL